jgi:hypothetical protein
MKIRAWLDSMQEERDVMHRRLWWRPRIVSGTLCSVRRESGSLDLVTETFRFRRSCDFGTALLERESIADALAEREFCIAPLGYASESGDEKTGTISEEGFRIVHTEHKTSPLDLVRRKVSDYERDYLARRHLTPILSFREEGWGYAPLIHARCVRTDDKGGCVAVVFVAPEGVALSDYQGLSDEIGKAVGGAEVQFTDEGQFDSSIIVSLTIDTGNRDASTFLETQSLHLSRVVDRLRAKE